MSILMSQGRVRGSEPPFMIDSRLVTVDRALEMLVLYELAYGGTITKLTSTEVEVVTRVLGCVDTTSWVGSEAEMSVLVEAAIASITLSMVGKETTFDDTVIGAVMRFTQGIPLLVHLGGDIIKGGMSTRMILIAMLNTPTEIERFKLAPVKDLYALVALVRFEGVTIADALTLL